MALEVSLEAMGAKSKARSGPAHSHPELLQQIKEEEE